MKRFLLTPIFKTFKGELFSHLLNRIIAQFMMLRR